MTIQSYLFDKEKWTEAKAKKWVKDHEWTVSMSEEVVTKFSEENGLSQETATKILAILYKKGEDAKSLDRLLWKMEMFLKKNEIPKLMEKMSADQIGKLIDEMIAEDEMSECWPACCNEQFTAWGFSEMGEEFAEGKVFEAGDKVEIQIMRAWKWNHPMYWEINITPETLSDVKKNFDEQARGIDLAVDENHESNHKALGWFRELTKKGKDSLFATIELTKKGAELLSEGAYKYFSPEIVFNKQDEESWKSIKNLLIGGAFTNRPFFKAMQPLLASEWSGSIEAADRHQNNDGHSASESNNILFFNTSNSMKKFLELIALFCEKTSINAEELASLEAAFSEVGADFKTAELTAAYDEMKAKFSEEGAADAGADQGSDEAGADTGSDTSANSDDKDESASEEGKNADAAADPAKADDKKDEPAAADTSEKKVEANEKGEITIKASEYEALKAIQSNAAKLAKEARVRKIDATFSEIFTNLEKQGAIIAPVSKKKITDLAAQFSEKQEETFTSVFSEIKFVQSGEFGSSAEGADNFSEENAEKIAYFTEKLGLTKEQAIEALKNVSK